MPLRETESGARHLKNIFALRTTRLLVLLLTLASLPILFVYHDQLSKSYNSNTNAVANSVATPVTSNSSSISPPPSSSPSNTTTLWSSMQTIDYIYMVLTLLIFILHVHPAKPFFRTIQTLNLCILVLLSFIWISLSILWFTDLLWMNYDPLLGPSAASLPSYGPTTSLLSSISIATVTPTATVGPPGIPAAIVGYTLFPSGEPTAITSIAFTTLTTTATSQPTATPTSIAPPSPVTQQESLSDVQWAAQCHTAEGLGTGPCELMMVYHFLGCFIALGLLIEGSLSWLVNMQEEPVEAKLKRLQAIDERKTAKRTKRIQKEFQAQARIPVIQGPMIG
ncbi:hypothetical protein BC939DRAFT_443990 [Gamsiella multidivaricata]|uniref:uncharacterized protein n=1 Tax=Gamsiella multidivaricata TaxID=101098 RepID=UPI00221E8446|nr:uncharacterized protein BC939DRAFT_443990 [Gamsiella multidivaricata]KAG0363107.1 hypothetical protein BGZ54_008319 [Gamsiella multidivaricata]KAI7828240.1 hypothetical protein BC939DRAFT_443990 [Gamsiella multidivaricata]